MGALSPLAAALERFEPVIGLEVHAQLRTRSKIFCSTPVAYDPEHPNRYVDEYCMGLPGVLPVLNRAAVDMAIRAGLALGCQIRKRSIWARKHYFYPDLPKGYQISQYDQPLCEHGHLDIPVEGGATKRVRIVRIHMEEDAGKSIHAEHAPISLIDYNRSGVPLIELVSGPDLSSAREASSYLKELRSILMALEICDGNMERGSFRCDANVSIRPKGAENLGTRCEIKNINSFRFVEQAIEFEIARHARVIESGGSVEQETRLFDSVKKETRSMRSKEEAHDYRYFPDPDLPPLEVTEEWIERARQRLPELPGAKRRRYTTVLGIPDEHAMAFSEEPDVAAFFDAAVEAYPQGRLPIAHMIKGEVMRELKDTPEGIRDAKIRPSDLAELVRLKDSGKISSTQQKKMFQELWSKGTPLPEIIAREGKQIDDPEVLGPMIDEAIARSPKEAQKLRDGNMNLVGHFVGQVMRASEGKANPAVVRDLLIAKISPAS